MNLKNQHLLSIDQFSSLAEVEKIFKLARKLEAVYQRKEPSCLLQGKILANLFFEPSTRTRMSFTSAFQLLGGSVIDVTETNSSIMKGESLFDMGRTMSAYADVIVMRHPEVQALQEFVAAAQVPVINGGNGIGEHPTQALLDVYTLLKERGERNVEKIKPLTIAMVGDLKHGRTVHSLSKLLSLCGHITFKLISPKALKMPSSIVKLLVERGNRVVETESLNKGVEGVDVLYMTRIQEERFATKKAYQQFAGKYAIDLAFYKKYCSPHTIIMHPMPRNSRLAKPEISADLNDHPNLAIFRQAQNGVPIRMAVFCFSLQMSV